MTIEEIKKILGITTLDEAAQAEATEKLEMLIDVKSRERADSIVSEEKDRLVEEYEAKFEEYKKDITAKFSNFVDSVLDEELEIPEKIMEFAKIGEQYHELITEFKKQLAIDAGVLSEDVKSLLKEAKDEIVSLKGKVDELTGKNMEIEADAKEMAAQLYIQKKCEGLSEAKRTKVVGLLGELRDKEAIDKKFQFVVDHVINEEDHKEDDEKDEVCSKCGDKLVEGKCPKCDKVEENNPDPVSTEGDGKAVVEEPKPVITEDQNPFEQIKNRWIKILKENKI